MQQYIIEILTGKKPTAYFDAELAYNISRWSIFRVYSPVDFVVITPDGRRIGKNFENNTEINEIENAFYTGFDDHTEFVLIPNPQDGDYKVELQGIDGGGQYTMAVSFIDENNPQLNSEVQTNSFIASGSIDSFKVNYQADNPEITAMESEIDFKKLINLTDDFYNNGQISKNDAYNFLINNLGQLDSKYDKIITGEEKYNIEKQLEHMIGKIGFYYEKNWLDELAKNILISNINLLIKKL